MKRTFRSISALIVTIAVLTLASTRLPADTGTCVGSMTTVPFTDITGNIFFCQIAGAYFSGLTNGTTPTTYSPDNFVRRDQMAAFMARTQDSSLRRGGRKAALGQWGFPLFLPQTAKTYVGSHAQFVKSDGADLWVASDSGVTRVRASDGAVLGTWGVVNPLSTLVARGRIYVGTNCCGIYVIDPRTSPGPAQFLGGTGAAFDLATDGTFIYGTKWPNPGTQKVDPDTGSTTLLTAGLHANRGILFDGINLWVTDVNDSDPSRTSDSIKRLDLNGNVIQSVSVPLGPGFPAFDGTNIWLPSFVDTGSGSGALLTVIRARDGAVLATLNDGGLTSPYQAAFDGQYILVTNQGTVGIPGSHLAVWKAADFTSVGSFDTYPLSSIGVCSDGINFWITLSSGHLGRL